MVSFYKNNQNNHSPIGLSINSHTPAGIAVSIAAELVKVNNKK
ncbi:MAG: XdhC family protein [Ignavibacteriales bacterium]|nr:XdhC family protein [Ignavibacteriales bacterium]